jgi:surface polysaccharide O-acyltransferase-like enzyme
MLDVTDTVFGPSANYIGLYSGYLMIGWLIRNYNLTPKLRLPLFVVWLLSSVASGMAARAGQPWATFGLGYSSPLLMVSSGSGLILLKNLIEKSKAKWIDSACRVAPLSLGIYLIHSLLLEYIWPQDFHPFTPAVLIPLKTTMIFIGTAIVFCSGLSKSGRN